MPARERLDGSRDLAAGGTEGGSGEPAHTRTRTSTRSASLGEHRPQHDQRLAAGELKARGDVPPGRGGRIARARDRIARWPGTPRRRREDVEPVARPRRRLAAGPERVAVGLERARPAELAQAAPVVAHDRGLDHRARRRDPARGAASALPWPACSTRTQRFAKPARRVRVGGACGAGGTSLVGRASRVGQCGGERGGGRPRWGWRDGGDRGWDVGPDEQEAAGGVVDDEARGWTQAARSEPLVVAVAG